MSKKEKNLFKRGFNNIRLIPFRFSVFVQIMNIGYLILTISLNKGILWAKIALLSVSIIYTIFFIATFKSWMTKEDKQLRRNGKLIYGYLKRIINFLVIVLSIVQIYLYPDQYKIINIVSTLFLAFIYVMMFFFDFIKIGIKRKKKKHS